MIWGGDPLGTGEGEPFVGNLRFNVPVITGAEKILAVDKVFQRV